jgi:hypothetical protein
MPEEACHHRSNALKGFALSGHETVTTRGAYRSYCPGAGFFRPRRFSHAEEAWLPSHV